MSQAAVYGAEVAVERSFQGPDGCRQRKATEATPEPLSVAVATSCTAGPPTVALNAGWVSEPDGSALSTVTVTTALVPVLPLPSTATARRS